MNIAVYTTAQAFLILLITKTAPTGIQLLGLTARFAKDSQLTLNIYSELLVFVCVFFSVLPKSHLRFVHLEPDIKTACLTHLPSVKFSLHKIAQLKVMQFFFRLALAKKVYLPRMKLVTQWVLFPKYVWN